jgi:transcriptional regulator, XRE family
MIKIIIGSRIREFRQSSDLSQEKLALKAGIDRTYLAGVENGKRNISVVNLDKIIKALDINYEIFFKGL